jgi:exonuclease III
MTLPTPLSPPRHASELYFCSAVCPQEIGGKSGFLPAGNHERIGFVFDRRAAVLTGLASNIHAPRSRERGEYVATPSWWRAPYIASFRAGSFDFDLLAAHIRWGGDGKPGEQQRLPEIRLLADWVAKRARANRDLIVVGDFNIPSTDSPLYQAITARGLRMPRALLGEHGSNLERNKRYDQILHLSGSSRTR